MVSLATADAPIAEAGPLMAGVVGALSMWVPPGHADFQGLHLKPSPPVGYTRAGFAYFPIGIIQPFVKVLNLTYPQIDKVMGVNFYGLLYMTKTFLPYLLKRPEAHIVNLSSMGGFLPVPGQTIYGASKAAVMLFTEGLNSELLDTNVHVTIVFPGAVKTNITVNSGVMTFEQQSQQDLGKMKMTSPEDASQMILSGIEANQYRVLVGSDAKLMDFLYRLNPKRAARFIYNQMKALLI